jgi:hypothetical protein
MNKELDKAIQARLHGNEGKARVCARRAAGLAAQEYFDRKGIHVGSSSALILLNRLREQQDLPVDLHPLIDHLLLPVDRDFKLPAGMDLIADARLLSNRLDRI